MYLYQNIRRPKVKNVFIKKTPRDNFYALCQDVGETVYIWTEHLQLSYKRAKEIYIWKIGRLQRGEIMESQHDYWVCPKNELKKMLEEIYGRNYGSY